MKYGVYCIRDSLVGFLTPTLEPSDPVAMRNFAMAVDSSKRDRSLMAFRPSDFILYRIAEFDTDTGELDPHIPPITICHGNGLEAV